MSTEDKPAHLIERAAARMIVPWGEVMARRPATAADPARIAERNTAPKFVADDRPPAERTAPTPIGADFLAAAGLIDGARRRTRVAEEFRIVQSKILREAFGSNSVAATPRGNLILVTSALQGEGKSFVALNLAAGIARPGDRRVLLVDIDTKRDSLSELLGVPKSPGLLNLIRSGGRHIDELIIPTAAANLDFLPLGSGAEENSELLASKRAVELLEEMSRRFADRPIVFDSSPCLSSSNPHALAPLVGQVIVVVAAGSTHQGDIEAALDLVQNCPNVSLLLNKIAPWNLHSFGAYAYPPPSA